LEIKFSNRPKIFTLGIILALGWLPLGFLIMMLYQKITVFPDTVYFQDTPSKAYMVNILGGLLISAGVLLFLFEKVWMKAIGVLTILIAFVLIFSALHTYTYIDSTGIHTAPLEGFKEEVTLWNDINQVVIVLDKGEPEQLEFESENDTFIYTLKEYMPRMRLREWLDGIGVEYSERNL
jgi:hypothetical protein